VWGEADSLIYPGIQVSRYSLSITEDCEAALAVILEEHGPTTIWVDSICIDQGNTADMNYQIRLMGLIYQRAHTVFIWLNPDPGLKDSMQSVKMLAANPRPEIILEDSMQSIKMLATNPRPEILLKKDESLKLF
jgi:hypothetical protein